MASAQHREGRILSKLATLDPPKFRAQIRKALKKHDGVVCRAADDLKIGTRQLWRWLKRDPSLFRGIGHKGNPSKMQQIAQEGGTRA